MGAVRLFLALSVVLWHLPGGRVRALNAAVAVTCFFVISGFYMTMVINENYARPDRPWVMEFYAARVLRLYPAYLAMIAIMAGWFWSTGAPGPFTSRLPMPAAEQIGLMAMNLLVFGQDTFQLFVQAIAQGSGPPIVATAQHWLGPGFFNDPWMLVGQAWSLSSELTFYLIAPFVVRSPIRIAVVFAASLLVRTAFVGILGYRSGVWGYWFFPATLCMFMLGSIAYHAHWWVRLIIPSKVIGWGGLGVLTLLIGAQLIRWQVAMPSNPEGSIDGPRFWLLYLAFAAMIPSLFELTRGSGIDRAIGELSYPLYLVHGIVLGLIYMRWGAPKGVLPDAFVAVGLSVLAAWALKVAVEAPVDRHRQRAMAAAAA